MNCQNCDSYNRGNGSPACLKCAKYRDICKRSGRRRTIQIEIVPQAILEEVEDEHPRLNGLKDILQSLPPDMASVISLVYVAGLTQREAAKQLNISQAGLSKKINVALEIIRKSI